MAKGYVEDWITAHIDDEVIFVIEESVMRGFRKADGKLLWRVDIPELHNDATTDREIAVTTHGLFVAGPSRLVALAPRQAMPLHRDEG